MEWLITTAVVMAVALLAFFQSGSFVPVWAWFIVLAINIPALWVFHRVAQDDWRFLPPAISIGPLTLIGYSTWMGALMIQSQTWGMAGVYGVVGCTLAWLYGYMLRSTWRLPEVGIATLLGMVVPLIITKMDPQYSLAYVVVGISLHYMLGVWRWGLWRKAVEARRINKAFAQMETRMAGHHSRSSGVARDRQVELLDLFDESRQGMKILGRSLAREGQRNDPEHLAKCLRVMLDPLLEIDAKGTEYWTIVDWVDLIEVANQAADAARNACPSANIDVQPGGHGVLRVPWRSGDDTLAWVIARLATHLVGAGATQVALVMGVGAVQSVYGMIEIPYIQVTANAPLDPAHRRGLQERDRTPEHIAALPDYLQRIVNYIAASGASVTQRIEDDGKGHTVDIRFIGDLAEQEERLERAARARSTHTQGAIH